MRTTVAALVLVSLAVGLGSAWADRSQRTNGLVSFGACCGTDVVGIYTINQDGSGEQRIFHPRFDDAPLASAWSPLGTRVAFVAPGGLWTMSASGQQRKRLTKGNGDTLAPSWSPDGKQIAFVDRVAPHGSNYALYVIGRNGKGLKRIVGGARYQNNPSWSPSGKLIMFERGNMLWTVKPNGRGQKRLAAGTSAAGRRTARTLPFRATAISGR